jgi:universal stress protein A
MENSGDSGGGDRRYRTIIAALDLSRESDAVARRAAEVARQHGALLVLVHVTTDLIQEASYEFMASLPIDPDLQRQLEENAREGLQGIAERTGYGRVETLVTTGPPKGGILTMAREREADLIVLGNHGVHGLELLLGSTANAVLHSAPCDVLAVKVGS